MGENLKYIMKSQTVFTLENGHLYCWLNQKSTLYNSRGTVHTVLLCIQDKWKALGLCSAAAVIRPEH